MASTTFRPVIPYPGLANIIAIVRVNKAQIISISLKGLP
jgi:hypothetical protein